MEDALDLRHFFYQLKGFRLGINRKLKSFGYTITLTESDFYSGESVLSLYIADLKSKSVSETYC